MTYRRLLAATAALLLTAAALAADGPAPSDYAARQRQAAALRQARDFPGALYHSLWLAWLAPQEYREAAEPALRDRDLRDRAHRASGDDPLGQILDTALQASQTIAATCLNGAVAQQTGRLERDLADLARQAEGAQARMKAADPVASMALAHLYLSWDDVLRLEQDGTRARDRVRLLRKAASAVEAAAGALPQAPGPRRTEATVRARLAAIGNGADQWAAAISAAALAAELDHQDASLCELLWGLNLHAGNWEEAKLWRTRREQAAPNVPDGVAPPRQQSRTADPIAASHASPHHSADTLRRDPA